MDSVFTFIQMACATMVSMPTIKRKDLVFTHGLMVGDTKEGGTKVSSTDLVCIKSWVKRLSTVFGKMESELNGLARRSAIRLT